MQNMINGVISKEEISTLASEVEYMEDIDSSEI
jgi:hypothetical protein